MRKYNSYYVPICFFVLSVLGIMLAEVSTSFILGELYSRFIRNGVFLLALIPPIMAGMGINFSITVGAIAAQMAMVVVIDLGLEKTGGFLLAIVLSVLFALVLGNIIGTVLNKAKGKEMIASMVIGFLGTNIYLLIFMVGYGTVIKPFSETTLISSGIGVKSMLDAARFRSLYEGVLPIRVGNVSGSLVPVLAVLVLGLAVWGLTRSKLGYHMKAVGEDQTLSEKAGIDVDRVRKSSIVLSTVLASLGQLMFIQNMGVLNVYTGHLNLDVFSAAALLVGGATLKNASVKNAFIGILLFHTLFIVSPMAGQNLFDNVALGEYFRSFLAYGTIVFAFVVNLRRESEA
ncbi:branched-chain amino acid transport system / permease component [Andreesenia angusta]|uniref:Branched-chain amino acid transport system / permease component n=1 Tax=Andreesenia angusta TaxID=39480 RepID=A0A1S1V7K2_9FIRM|nr:hypothetical protein [Andreesenia angusta]OHW61699.1 branched-chain amino acid transport system / permease component [Andreesenia angusta]